MLRTFRAKVDDDGAIRLYENEDLPVGHEVLVTVLDRHQLLPLMGPNGEIRISAEQQLNSVSYFRPNKLFTSSEDLKLSKTGGPSI